MRKFGKLLFFVICLGLLIYSVLPNPSFPEPPVGSFQSDEPADTETTLRRGYYTNSTREEVMIHYMKQFNKSSFFGLPLPTYRLNYPPEEAQTYIRDQTRSTFLEEIVHPLRESLFVNGFEPKEPKDVILVNEKNWRQKITVRLAPSSTLPRLVVALSTLILLVLIMSEYYQLFTKKSKNV